MTKTLVDLRVWSALYEEKEMEVDPTVLQSIERFLELAEKYPDEVTKTYAQKEDYYFSDENQRKYVYVSAPRFMFRVHPTTGAIHATDGRRPGYCLTIFDFVNWREWKYKKITFRRNGIPVKTTLQCGICTRTDTVGRTLDGLRCRACRSSRTRHVSTLRNLGFLPAPPNLAPCSTKG